MSRPHLPPPKECAQCGASIPRKARACPACGADERTGWRETSIYDGLDLPEEAFAEDADSGNSPGNKRHISRRDVAGLAWYWWVIGVMMLFTLGFGVLGLLR